MPWAETFLASLVGILVVHKVTGFIPDISSSPLTIGWSEASRYYYASLFFSKQVYGTQLALPFLHPTRYLLQSLPFLIPGLPLIAHRFWQVFLWLGMTGLAAVLLVRRLNMSGKSQRQSLMRWALGAWAFLFLFQGPVYYHLLVPVCLVLWGYDQRRFWRTLLVVVVASGWAGISRINWFPVPAMLAAAIHLLEVPQSRARSLLSYLTLPFIWGVVGLSAAFIAQALYIRISGNDPGVFGSSLSSDLLWYRLWPSNTYPPGILPMTLLVSFPLLLIIGIPLFGRALSWVRKLALVGMLAVLLVGGLVVSVKIGGGSNLHNLDAFLTLLLICGAWLGAGRGTAEERAREPGPIAFPRLHWSLILLAVLVPVYPLLLEGRPFPSENLLFAGEETQELNSLVQQVRAQGGEVLFIWQRQLVTFGWIDAGPLEPRFETVDLMEMAMSNNQVYLNNFYQALREHRFALIVSQVQSKSIKGTRERLPRRE